MQRSVLRHMVTNGAGDAGDGHAQDEAGVLGPTARRDQASLLRRRTLIERIEELRGSTVITYITSTRPAAGVVMAPDAIPILYKHLRRLGLNRETSRIDLLIHTDGGQSTLPWRLMSLLREFGCEISLLIPHHAYSAGTLAALGADHVVMHPMGILGPTDPQVTTPFNPRDEYGEALAIETEDVNSFRHFAREFSGVFGLTDELRAMASLARLVNVLTAWRYRRDALRRITDHVHPLALGAVRRSTEQSKLMAERLLKSRSPSAPALDEKVAGALTSALYDHRHAINRREAIDELGLAHVEFASPELEDLMWELYDDYAADMQLEDEYIAAHEGLLALDGKLPAAPPLRDDGESDIRTRSVGIAIRSAYIESREGSDWRQMNVSVTFARYSTGEVEVNELITADAWHDEESEK